jgi:flagellar assembly protein FliH
MGKIVKRAKFKDEKYVVVVPRNEVAPHAKPFDDDFDMFAVSNAATVRVEVDPFEQALAAEPAPQIDWGALKADAQAIVDRAAADADAMLVEAHTRALAIVAAAETRVTQIEAEARDRGHEEGVAAGKASVDAEMESMIHTMRDLIESARAERHEIIETAEPELVRLALAIAERVVHQHIALEPSVVVDNVRQALTRLATREVVTLRVNPADLDTIREHRDAIVASTDVDHLRIVEDQRVDRGGVIIETDAGTIDSKISTQLREARRAITADESTNKQAS